MGKANFIDRRYSRNDDNQNYGLNRENKQGTSTYANTPPGRNQLSAFVDKFLNTSGGKLHAPIGFDKKTIIIDGSNAIDIAQGGGNFVPRIVLDGTTSTTLDTISNPLFEGQKIYVQAWSTGTITIGVAGNIQTGLSLTANHIIELIYDFDVGKWIMPEDNVGSGSSGEVFTWTANHATGGFDLVNVNNLQFDIDGTNDGRINAPAGVGFQYITDTTSQNHEFFVGGSRHFKIDNGHVRIMNSSTDFVDFNMATSLVDFNDNRILNLGRLDMSGRIDCNSNFITACGNIYFGSASAGSGSRIGEDAGSNLEFGTDGIHEFFVGGTPQISIPSTGLKLHNTVDANFNIVDNFGEIKFGSTGNTSGGSTVSIEGLAGSMFFNVAVNDGYFFKTNGTSNVKIHDEGIEIFGGAKGEGWLTFDESTGAPGTSHAASNEAVLYAEDNGAGKTRLMCQFGTGAAQQIAIEP